MTQEAIPSATTADRPSRLRVPMLVGAMLIGGAFILGARHYKRADPPTEPPAPGMKVGSVGGSARL